MILSYFLVRPLLLFFFASSVSLGTPVCAIIASALFCVFTCHTRQDIFGADGGQRRPKEEIHQRPRQQPQAGRPGFLGRACPRLHCFNLLIVQLAVGGCLLFLFRSFISSLLLSSFTSS